MKTELKTNTIKALFNNHAVGQQIVTRNETLIKVEVYTKQLVHTLPMQRN